MNDQELRQAMQALENYNQQLESINRQARIIQSTRDETTRASRTIQALQDANPGDEILIPIGASCLITVQVSEKKKTVIGVGNKISVEKDLPAAIEYLDGETKDLSEALQKTLAAMQEIQKYADELTKAVQAEYSLRRQQGLPQQ